MREPRRSACHAARSLRFYANGVPSQVVSAQSSSLAPTCSGSGSFLAVQAPLSQDESQEAGGPCLLLPPPHPPGESSRQCPLPPQQGPQGGPFPSLVPSQGMRHRGGPVLSRPLLADTEPGAKEPSISTDGWTRSALPRGEPGAGTPSPGTGPEPAGPQKPSPEGLHGTSGHARPCRPGPRTPFFIVQQLTTAAEPRVHLLPAWLNFIRNEYSTSIR